MQNLEIWGLMGTRVKFVVESAIFGIADFDVPIHCATFMGLRWRLRVVYYLASPLLNVLAEKMSILGQILTFLE